MKKIVFLFSLLMIAITSFANLPTIPSNFKIVNSYNNAIMLTWNISNDTQDGFIIERSTDGKIWDFSKLVSSNTYSYLDVGLICNTKYYYRIYAVNNNGKSEYSKIQTGITVSTENCIIGTDTVSVSYPFSTYWSDSRTQIIYKKNEIYTFDCPVSMIFKIAFYITALPINDIYNFSIKMQHTQDTVLTGFINSNWTTVYTGTLQLNHTGWHQINLSPFFYYNQQYNLLMEICYDMSSYTNNIKVRSSQAYNKVWHYHTDGAAGCSLTGGSVQTYRPNIMFTPVINTVIKLSELKNPEYRLEQNYPNPFNSSTKFRFRIKKSGPVTLSIYDILGRQEIIVFSEPLGPGEYEKLFSTDKFNLSSGIYYYCLSTPDYSEVKKMVVLK